MFLSSVLSALIGRLAAHRAYRRALRELTESRQDEQDGQARSKGILMDVGLYA